MVNKRLRAHNKQQIPKFCNLENDSKQTETETDIKQRKTRSNGIQMNKQTHTTIDLRIILKISTDANQIFPKTNKQSQFHNK